MELKANKAMQECIDWIKNNPYTEAIISISNVKPLGASEQIIVSEKQGEYPVDVKFTPMQKVEVTYQNKYYGAKTDIIVAGFDAVRYTMCNNDMYEGTYLNKNIIAVEFVGEYAKICPLLQRKSNSYTKLENTFRK